MMTTVLLLSDELCIFLFLCLAAAFRGSATFAQFAVLCLLLIFSVPAIDFGENFFDSGIGVRVNEMTEQISEAEEIAETS